MRPTRKGFLMKQSKELIVEQLDRLSQIELEEINYFVSTYKKSPTVGQSGKVPMHFFGRLVGLRQLAENQVEMSLGIHNVNTYGVAQGGSIYTLADVTIGFMILNQLIEGQKVFTLEMKVNFITKGVGTRLIATPTILRLGRTTVVAECTIEDEDGNLVAKALGTFYVV